MGIEATHAHEQFVGQQKITDFIYCFDGTNNFHQKDKHQLAVEEVICNFRIISLSSMPEESVTECFLQLIRRVGHRVFLAINLEQLC